MNAALFRFLVIFQEHAAGAASGNAATGPTPPPKLAPPPGAATGDFPVPKGLPSPPGPEVARDVKEGAVNVIEKIIGFFKYDFFPNLWMYLTLIFMLVIGVVIFAGINIVVRSITDPIFHKIFRFDESSRVPMVIGGLLSLVVTVLAFQWLYNTFPALKPPVNFVLSKF